MSHSKQQKHEHISILSGNQTLFPEIYDAISEQVLLLIFKARQLYMTPEYRAWFTEQHQVLGCLCKQSDKIKKLFPQEDFTLGTQENNKDELDWALIFMHQLYRGFDEGNVSLKTWGEMHLQPANFLPQNVKRYKNPNTEFVREELFSILTDSKVHCSPIPPHIRQGYSHQALSIAHSHTKKLLAQLNKYHEISHSQILALTIYETINALKVNKTNIPDWLSIFSNEYTSYIGNQSLQSETLRKFVKLINEKGSESIIKDITSPSMLLNLFRIYNYIYVTEINNWVAGILNYLDINNHTAYRWKFTTVSKNVVAPDDTFEYRNSIEWNTDYCNISITRDNIFKLIRTNTLHDATSSLADCLEKIYLKSLREIMVDDDTIPPITDIERQIHSSSDPIFKENNCKDTGVRISEFEEWYKKNKVLLVNPKKKRIEKIDVTVRLAGLKGYDLQMGIPDGKKMKITDNLNDNVKKDNTLRLPSTISHVSLNRYRYAVQHIIKNECDLLLQKQKEMNVNVPYSGDLKSIKPFWGKYKSNGVK